MSRETEEATLQKVGERNLYFTVDSFANGISFGQHSLEPGQDERDYYGLRLHDEGSVVRLSSRYALHKENPLHGLEANLMRLSRQGVLRSAVIYFGVSMDPFLPFDGKFEASMKFLALFERYTPGMLIVQTRSPLVVIAMPVFKKLGQKVAVTIAVETPLEEMVQRYTPGLPRVAERLKVATALRRFGVKVNMQVSPVLPYGDWKNDAANFAELLCEHADSLHVMPLTDGTEKLERRLRATSLVKKLSADRRFHWLRPDSANPLITAIEKTAPEKLRLIHRGQLTDRQVKMFAA